MSDSENNRSDACTGCELADRRAFITRMAATAVGALIGLGMSAERALAMPLGVITGMRQGDGGPVTYPIPAADGATIDRANDVILARYQGRVFAFGLACPHQNTALRWNEKDGRFKCPKHNSRYQPDGLFIDGRATRGMDRFSVAIQGANVVVDVNAMHKQDADPTGWAAAMVKLPPG